jgi:hypothetical protein
LKIEREAKMEIIVLTCVIAWLVFAAARRGENEKGQIVDERHG